MLMQLNRNQSLLDKATYTVTHLLERVSVTSYKAKQGQQDRINRGQMDIWTDD